MARLWLHAGCEHCSPGWVLCIFLTHPSRSASSICGLSSSLHHINLLWASNIAVNEFTLELGESPACLKPTKRQYLMPWEWDWTAPVVYTVCEGALSTCPSRVRVDPANTGLLVKHKSFWVGRYVYKKMWNVACLLDQLFERRFGCAPAPYLQNLKQQTLFCCITLIFGGINCTDKYSSQVRWIHVTTYCMIIILLLISCYSSQILPIYNPISVTNACNKIQI